MVRDAACKVLSGVGSQTEKSLPSPSGSAFSKTTLGVQALSIAASAAASGVSDTATGAAGEDGAGGTAGEDTIGTGAALGGSARGEPELAQVERHSDAAARISCRPSRL